jgi:hypothetical protein
MNIKVGDRVKVKSSAREKWNLPHLTGEYKVRWVKDDYIVFFTGERVNQNSVNCKRGERRWHKKHLILVCGVEENE